MRSLSPLPATFHCSVSDPYRSPTDRSTQLKKACRQLRTKYRGLRAKLSYILRYTEEDKPYPE